jgi:flagellar hook-basal body complex protein FliE
MSIVDPVGFLPPQALMPADAASAPGFAQWLSREVASTNQKLGNAERLVQRLAAGDTGNLHEVMIGIEQARLQFQLVMQVRNRMLEAYQDLLRMQV